MHQSPWQMMALFINYKRNKIVCHRIMKRTENFDRGLVLAIVVFGSLRQQLKIYVPKVYRLIGMFMFKAR